MGELRTALCVSPTRLPDSSNPHEFVILYPFRHSLTRCCAKVESQNPFDGFPRRIEMDPSLMTTSLIDFSVLLFAFAA